MENSTDTIKVNVYRSLAYHYRFISIDTSFYYGQMSYDLAIKNNWTKLKISALLRLGYLESERGNIIEGEHYFREGLKIGEEIKDTFLLSTVTNAVGICEWKSGRNDKAIKSFQKAYDLSLVSNNEQVMLYALNNMGLISLENERFENAIGYFETAKKIPLAEKKMDDKALLTLNIGVTYLGQEKYDLALDIFQEAKQITKSIRDYTRTSLIYLNIGEIKFSQKKYTESIDSLDQSISIARKHELNDLIAKSSKLKATVLIEVGEYDSAIKHINESLKLSLALGLEDEVPECFEILASAYEKKEDYKTAMHFQKEYSTLTDSLYKLGREKDISRLEISFQTREKDMENALLKKEKEQQELLVLQRTRIAGGISIVLFLLMIVAFLLFRGRQKTRLMNKVLEEKVKERTIELEGLNDKLLKSNGELKRFAFIASHDLKEPLRNVGGFLSLIRRRIRKRDDKELNEYIEFVEKNNYQMVDLVDNILSFANIESQKKSKVGIINLSNEIENACTLLSQMIAEEKAEVTYQAMPSICFNTSIFKILFKNLIENGIKYNNSKPIKVAISSKVEGDRFLIFVKDNGIGIDPEYHEKVFEMFTRLHNRSAYSGSGMGLAFCKKIIENSGGFISVESEEWEGSTFVIDIPAKVVNSESSKEFLSKVTDLGSINVN